MFSSILMKGTIEAIDAQRRAFIWAGVAICNVGQCKVAWSVVCTAKEQGGLEVKDLALQNRGHMSKSSLSCTSLPQTGSGGSTGSMERTLRAILGTITALIPQFGMLFSSSCRSSVPPLRYTWAMGYTPPSGLITGLGPSHWLSSSQHSSPTAPEPTS
jgi:hypothetical protein